MGRSVFLMMRCLLNELVFLLLILFMFVAVAMPNGPFQNLWLDSGQKKGTKTPIWHPKMESIRNWLGSLMALPYSIVKDSSANLGVILSIVQNWPIICRKISYFLHFWYYFDISERKKEASFFLFWIFKLKQPLFNQDH